MAWDTFYRKYCICIVRIRCVPSFRLEWVHQFLPLFFLSGFCTGLSGLFTGGFAVISPQFQGKSGAQGRAGLNLLYWSFCAKAAVGLLGFVCFYYKPEHVGITDHSQICLHPPHTNKKEKEPLLFPFFVQLRSFHGFLLSRRAKEVK